MHHFCSNGKLLITGEYLILDGALSLAVPTKFGQSLTVKASSKKELIWKSLDENGEAWFETQISLQNINQCSTNDATAKTLVKILAEAQKLNPTFLKPDTGFLAETKLGFPRNWGLGSSSTLINNIAQWANVDAFKLLWNSFSGSGYDIACAQHNKPILYQLKNKKPQVQEVNFSPPFKESIFFIHLNQKQDSREGISAYKNSTGNKQKAISKVSELTQNMLACTQKGTFTSLIEQHEMLISEIIGLKPVKQSLFPDFSGGIKSLGAWGGDFIMAVGDENIPAYFNKKGYHTVIPYIDMVLPF
mgnify:CR=1 FL=1